MTASMVTRVLVLLRQRSKRAGSRNGPSRTSLLKWPRGMPAGTAFKVASTPALGGTLKVAGGDGSAAIAGATVERGLPPDKPRTACVSESGGARAAYDES